MLAYICLGSNMGDALACLATAREQLAISGQLTAISSIYRTEPQDDKAQPWFHNQVVALETFLAPRQLLVALQAIESNMGRVRDAAHRFGPRVIDLDILMMENIETSGGNPPLELPHPRMDRRAFVLVPLREIAPRLILPNGQSIDSLLGALEHRVEGDKIFQ